MRKLTLGLAVSLDGYIEGPNGEYDWCFTDQDYGMDAFYKQVDAVFIGRKSYELMLGMGEEAGGYLHLKKYVFSNTLQSVGPGELLLGGEVQERVRQIKNEDGKDIWLFGGASLTSSLMNLGLVDELWLSVHPIILGAGKPLFEAINQRIDLHLVETKTYETGLVSLKYAVRQH